MQGWTREDAALADTFSIQDSAVGRAGLGLQIVEVGYAGVAAQVADVLMTVSVRAARPSLRYCLEFLQS